MHVNYPMLSRSPPRDGTSARTERMCCKVFCKTRKRTVSGGKNKKLAIELKDMTTRGAAKPGRAFDESLQNEFQVKCRTANRFEDVGGGRLLLKRFALLANQSRVLDGNDGLRGKICYQPNLAFCKWVHR